MRAPRGFFGLLAAAAAIYAGAALIGAAPQGPAAAAQPAERLDYNWDVRPILSENCFQCHGPDEKARRANLRLDERDGATRLLNATTGRRAVVPGDPENSELLKRVTHATVAMRMPPSITNKTLTADQHRDPAPLDRAGRRVQTALVVHFSAEARGAASEAGRAVAVTEIDRFVLCTAAARRTGAVARGRPGNADQPRHADLTGLPPTLAEVDAFLADTSPNAYEKVVDRLLASPAYGEHMARVLAATSRAIRKATAFSTTTTIDCSGPTATG